MSSVATPDDSPDRFAEFAFCLAGAALGLALARLVGASGVFPGTALVDEVVGALSREPHRKANEQGFVFAAFVLVPLCAFVADRIARQRIARDRDCGVVLVLASVVSIALGLGFALDAGAETIFDPLRAQRSAAYVALAIGVGIGAAAFRSRALTWVGRVARTPRALAIGAALPTLAMATLSVGVFALAVGPRIAPNSPHGLGRDLVRVGGALLGAAFVCTGMRWITLALLLDPNAGSYDSSPESLKIVRVRIERALRHTTWLLMAALAPTDFRVVGLALSFALVGTVFECLRKDVPRGKTPGRNFFDAVALPALVLVLVLDRAVDGPIDLFHAGEWLTPAYEVFSGKRPYTDVFLQHGLIQNALRNAITFAWFDTTFEANRRSEALAYALTHAAAFFFAARIYRSRFVALAVVLLTAASGLHFAPRFGAAFLALAAIAAAIRGTAPLPRSCVVAGIFTAIAFFYSVDSGLFTSAAILVFLALDARHEVPNSAGRASAGVAFVTHAGRFLLGLAIGAMPFAAYLASQGSLAACITNTYDSLRLQLSVWGLPFPSPAPSSASLRGALTDPVWIARAAAILYLSVLWGWSIAKGPASPFRRIALLLAIAGACWFRTALGRSDEGHLRYGSVFLWFLAPAIAEEVFHRMRSARCPPSFAAVIGFAPATALAGALLLGYAPIYTLAMQWIRLGHPTMQDPPPAFARPPLPNLGRVHIPRAQAQALSTLHDFVEERLLPGETYFDFTNLGAAYFLLGRHSPTRYVMAAYAATVKQQREAIAELEETRPRMLVTNSELGLPRVDGILMEDRAPLVAEYLRRCYGTPIPAGFGFVCFRKVDADVTAR